jgi:hypothetical protein
MFIGQNEIFFQWGLHKVIIFFWFKVRFLECTEWQKILTLNHQRCPLLDSNKSPWIWMILNIGAQMGVPICHRSKVPIYSKS